jgi:hypothetical protein
MLQITAMTDVTVWTLFRLSDNYFSNVCRGTLRLSSSDYKVHEQTYHLLICLKPTPTTALSFILKPETYDFLNILPRWWDSELIIAN